MARLIGTAGHVDHGKTCLIQALTGINADRLPEEKKRGLTIDIGFAYVELPQIGRVSIVDVPGHERFLSNMLVGAIGVDVALLCVASDESVKPQTREHLQILELLPVQRLVVAMTKVDLADPDTRASARDDVLELLSTSRFKGSPTIFVSSVTEEGMAELRTALATAIDDQKQGSEMDWYLPIDRVFSVKGHGVVVTGTLMAGVVSDGDEVWLEPGGFRARVRQIQGHDKPVPSAEKGQRTALNLGGVKMEDVHRGMVAAKPGTVFSTSILDLGTKWVSAPKHGERVRLSVGADEVIGRLFLNEHDQDIAQIRLERPCGVVKGQPFIMRRYSPPELLAGGSVLVPLAELRHKRAKALVSKVDDVPQSVLEAVSSAPHGIGTDEICRAVGRDKQALGDVFQALAEKRKILGFAGLWLTPENFQVQAKAFLRSLAALHDRNPESAGFPRDAVASETGVRWSEKPLDRIVTLLSDQGRIRTSGRNIALTGRGVTLNPAQRQMLDRVVTELETAGTNVPAPPDLALSLHVPVQAIDAVLRLGLETGEIVRLDEVVWYTSEQVQGFLQRAKQALGSKRFTASEFREALGTSRKYAIPLLEHFDVKGATYRQGETRVFN